MQKILRWTLLTFLLACVIGCAETSHYPQAGGSDFKVDDAKYYVNCFVMLGRKGQVSSSTLIVSPYYNYGRVSSWKYTSEHTPQGKFNVSLYLGDEKDPTIAKTHTLYFMQDGKIVLEKSYQELGIDASRFNASFPEALQYLQPILENLIREHVQPQEAEREGQEP
jgi:hypothetical protein